jgi:hypothetical protein
MFRFVVSLAPAAAGVLAAARASAKPAKSAASALPGGKRG